MLTPEEMMTTTQSNDTAICTTGVNSTESQFARILIVDDMRANRKVLSRLLKSKNYQTVEASDGAEAIEIIESSQVDMVLLDLIMPEIDGFEVLRHVRKTLNGVDLPVIIVTSSRKSDQIVKAFELGANDYITKPIDVAVTMARLTTHLKLKQAQEALRRSEERYSLIAQGSNDGLWDWDLTENVVYYSPRWAAMLGLEQANVESTPLTWLSRIHADDRSQVESELQKHLNGNTNQFEMELRMRHTDGGFRWMLCRGLAIPDDNGNPHRMAGSITDITESKVADALTGLPNRVLFQDRMRRCVDRKTRQPEYKFALIYLDLDNFKLINDSLGHDCGDRLIVSVAQRLESSVRYGDSLISRLGGDEFAILLEDISDEIDATTVAKRILNSFTVPFNVGGSREVFASPSMGISVPSQKTVDSAEIIQQADTAMHQAKANGKSCFELFDPAMKERVTRRLEIENELRHSLDGRDFELYYQPILEIHTNKVVSFEALIRWNHPEMGIVSPADFIPVTEDTGLIVPIGKWVLQEACRQIAEWRSKHRGFEHIAVSVNLSCRQLVESNLFSDITTILNETKLPPDALCLEVTETSFVQNPDLVGQLLSQLRDCGIKVAIDDFGTGYSSLAYLHRLPFDSLKIDRSFVNKMIETDDNLAIVGTIVTLANRLKLNIVAEGIETPEQRDLLKSLGCEYAQGFYYSRPVPAKDVIESNLIQSVAECI